jgi:hypothetical protein
MFSIQGTLADVGSKVLGNLHFHGFAVYILNGYSLGWFCMLPVASLGRCCSTLLLPISWGVHYSLGFTHKDPHITLSEA